MGCISERQIEIWETVKRAQRMAREAVRDGGRASDVDLAARRVIGEKGWGKWFTHRLGHGIGIEGESIPIERMIEAVGEGETDAWFELGIANTKVTRVHT